jgi:protein-disulfide isomerase
MILKAVSTVVLSVALLGSSAATAENIYSLGGKSVTRKNLPDGLKQKFFEIEQEAFLKKEAATLDQMFTDHVNQISKKTGKSADQVSNDLLQIKEPTEGELKQWYEANKARIPYPFDQIKGQITQFLMSEKSAGKKMDFVQKLAKEKKLKFSFKAPTAPTISINSKGFPVKGKKGAKLKIVEFADYYCPHCKHAFEDLRKLVKKHGSKIELTFMDFPIKGESSHQIARGAFCAGKQKKFWEYHDMAFENQKSLSDKSPETFAKALKLNESKFKACLSSKEARSHVDKSQAEGRRIGITGTPSVYINGIKVGGKHMHDLVRHIEGYL